MVLRSRVGGGGHCYQFIPVIILLKDLRGVGVCLSFLQMP